MDPNLNARKYLPTDILFAVLLTFFCFVCYRLFGLFLSGAFRSDFPFYAESAMNGGSQHRFLGVAYRLIYSATGSTDGMAVFSALIIGGIVIGNYFLLKYLLGKTIVARPLLQAAALFAMFLGPIYVPEFHQCFYKGVFQSFAWHSPTQQAMIVFSIPAFICFAKLYERYEESVDVKLWLLCMVFTLLSATGKPSFAIDLILGAIVMFAAELFLPGKLGFGEKFKRLFLIGCSFIPSGLYFFVVMYFNFGDKGERSGKIVFGLKSLLNYDGLFLAIICGLAFAILVWIFNLGKLRQRKMRTVVMIFLMGIVQWALVYEEGFRAAHGNFVWGRQVGCYFLMLSALAVFVDNFKNRSDFLSGRKSLQAIYFLAGGGLLVLHIASQILYFYLIFKRGDYYF